jgi:hypothetical protein
MAFSSEVDDGSDEESTSIDDRAAWKLMSNYG